MGERHEKMIYHGKSNGFISTELTRRNLPLFIDHKVQEKINAGIRTKAKTHHRPKSGPISPRTAKAVLDTY